MEDLVRVGIAHAGNERLVAQQVLQLAGMPADALREFGQADGQRIGPQMLGQVAAAVLRGEGTNRLLAARHVTPQRMLREHHLVEDDLNLVLRVVLVHAQLLEDDRPLALDVCGIEPGIRDDVEEHVKPKVEVLRGHARPVRGQLLVCRCVDESADALDRIRDLLRRGAAQCAFEIQVLDEVRHAGQPRVLEP